MNSEEKEQKKQSRVMIVAVFFLFFLLFLESISLSCSLDFLFCFFSTFFSCTIDHGQPQGQFGGAMPAVHSKCALALRAVVRDAPNLLRHFLAPFLRVHQRARTEVKRDVPGNKSTNKHTIENLLAIHAQVPFSCLRVPVCLLCSQSGDLAGRLRSDGHANGVSEPRGPGAIIFVSISRFLFFRLSPSYAFISISYSGLKKKKTFYFSSFSSPRSVCACADFIANVCLCVSMGDYRKHAP